MGGKKVDWECGLSKSGGGSGMGRKGDGDARRRVQRTGGEKRTEKASKGRPRDNKSGEKKRKLSRER